MISSRVLTNQNDCRFECGEPKTNVKAAETLAELE